MQRAPQDNQLMSKHRVLGFKPQLRLEWRGQDGQHEAEQPDHSASLGDSITSATRIWFSVHTGACIPRRWWNLKTTKPSASARLREFADRIYARDAGISMPQCVTGNASPPPNFEGSS